MDGLSFPADSGDLNFPTALKGKTEEYTFEPNQYLTSCLKIEQHSEDAKMDDI